MHLVALIVRHGLAHRRRFAIEHQRVAIDDGLGGRVIHLREHDEAGRALNERADR